MHIWTLSNLHMQLLSFYQDQQLVTNMAITNAFEKQLVEWHTPVLITALLFTCLGWCAWWSPVIIKKIKFVKSIQMTMTLTLHRKQLVKQLVNNFQSKSITKKENNR